MPSLRFSDNSPQDMHIKFHKGDDNFEMAHKTCSISVRCSSPSNMFATYLPRQYCQNQHSNSLLTLVLPSGWLPPNDGLSPAAQKTQKKVTPSI